jgi:hypothetical protein
MRLRMAHPLFEPKRQFLKKGGENSVAAKWCQKINCAAKNFRISNVNQR